MFFKKQKGNDQIEKKSAHVDNEVELKEQKNDMDINFEAQEPSNNDVKIVYNDKFNLSRIVYLDEEPSGFKRVDRDFYVSYSGRNRRVIRPVPQVQFQLDTEKSTNGQAANSNKVINTLKQQIFNETYRLLGIKSYDELNSDDDIAKILENNETDNILGIPKEGTETASENKTLKEELQDKSIDQIKDFANAVNKESTDGPKVIIRDETDRHGLKPHIYQASEAEIEARLMKKLQRDAINKQHQEVYLQELDKTIKEINKDTPKVTIEDIFVKPNEPKVTLFKETAPMVKNENRAGLAKDVKDTEWEKVKSFVKEFNTRNYAEVVGNVPGIIDVDNAIKINLNQKFYLSNEELARQQASQETAFNEMIKEYHHVLESKQAEALDQIFSKINSKEAIEFDKQDFISKQNKQNETNLKLLDENIKLKEEIKALEEELKIEHESPILKPKLSKLELEETLIKIEPEKASEDDIRASEYSNETIRAIEELKKKIELIEQTNHNEANDIEAILKDINKLDELNQESLSASINDLDLSDTNDNVMLDAKSLLEKGIAIDNTNIEATNNTKIEANVAQTLNNDSSNNFIDNLNQAFNNQANINQTSLQKQVDNNEINKINLAQGSSFKQQGNLSLNSIDKKAINPSSGLGSKPTNITHSSLNLNDLVNRSKQNKNVTNLDEMIANQNSIINDINNNLSNASKVLNNNDNISKLNLNNFTNQHSNEQDSTIDKTLINNQVMQSNLYNVDQQTLDQLVPSTSRISQINQELNDINSIVGKKNTINKIHLNTTIDQTPDLVIKDNKQAFINNKNQNVQFRTDAYQNDMFSNTIGQKYIKINIQALRDRARENNHGPINDGKQKIYSLAEAAKMKRRPY